MTTPWRSGLRRLGVVYPEHEPEHSFDGCNCEKNSEVHPTSATTLISEGFSNTK